MLSHIYVLLHLILLLHAEPAVTTIHGHTHLFSQGLYAGLANIVLSVPRWQQPLELLKLAVGLEKTNGKRQKAECLIKDEALKM